MDASFPSRPSIDRLESLLEFEMLLSDLSSRFINLPPADLDREIEQLVDRAPTPVRWFVLDAEAMIDVDTTGAEVLRQAITMLAGRDITFAVSRANRSFRSWLGKHELMELIEQTRFYPTNRHAAAAFREDLEKAT